MKGAATQGDTRPQTCIPAVLGSPEVWTTPARPGENHELSGPSRPRVRQPRRPAPSEDLGVIFFKPDPQVCKGKVLLCSPLGEAALPTACLVPARALKSPRGLAAKGSGSRPCPRRSAS